MNQLKLLLLLSLFFHFFSSSSYADNQPHRIKVITKQVYKNLELGNKDSLLFYQKELNRLESLTNDKISLAFIYKNLGKINLYASNYKNASINLKKSIQIFDSIYKENKNFKDELFANKLLLSDCYTSVNEYVKAIEVINSIKQLDLDVNSKDGKLQQIFIENNLAYINFLTENYSYAINNLNYALKLESELDYSLGKADSYSLYAEILNKQGDHKKALEYFYLASEIFLKENIIGGITSTQNNIGITQYHLKNYNLALKTLDKAINNAIAIDFKEGIAESNLYKAKIHYELLNYNETQEHLIKALSIFKDINNPDMIIECLLFQSKVANLKALKEQSLVYLKEAESIALKTNSKTNKRDVFKAFIDYYENNPNERIPYFEKYVTITNELNNNKHHEQFEVLKTQNSFIQQEAILAKQQSEIDLLKEREQTARDKTIFYVICIVFFIAIMVSFYVKQKNKLKRYTSVWKSERQVLRSKIGTLKDELNYKNKQITNFAIHISEKNDLLEHIKTEIKEINTSDDAIKNKIFEIICYINDDINANEENVELYSNINQTKESFNHKIYSLYPEISEKEKKILTLVKLNHTSKQIATQLNISPASVDNYRYTLKKKMNVPKGTKLSSFIKKI